MTGRATPVELELADFPSVVACANRIQELASRIDVLILNAGVIVDGLEQVNGLEKHFVVNHLGHFLLTNRVIDLVKAAPQGRVVTVGSGNHHDAPPGGIQFGSLSGEGWVGRGYHHSKLANGLFSLELARRLVGTRATSNCVTPGPVRTQILRNLPSASTAHQTKSSAQARQHNATSRRIRGSRQSRANTSRTAIQLRRVNINRTRRWQRSYGRCRLGSPRSIWDNGERDPRPAFLRTEQTIEGTRAVASPSLEIADQILHLGDFSFLRFDDLSSA